MTGHELDSFKEIINPDDKKLQSKIRLLRVKWFLIGSAIFIIVFLLLFIAYEWFGFVLLKMSNSNSFLEKPSDWCLENLPLCLIGMGLIKQADNQSYYILVDREGSRYLIKALITKDTETKFLALECLGEIGNKAIDVLPQIKSILIDEDDEELFNYGLVIISQIGSEKDIIPFYKSVLKTKKNTLTRSAVFQGIVNMRTLSSDSFSVLYDLFNSVSKSLRLEAIAHVAMHGKDIPQVLPFLVDLLFSPDFTIYINSKSNILTYQDKKKAWEIIQKRVKQHNQTDERMQAIVRAFSSDSE